MIGRFTDAGQLGIYALGNSVLAMLLWTQESLITRPYTIQLDRAVGTPAEHAFHALALNVLLSVAAMFLLGTIGLAGFASDAHPQLSDFAWVLSMTVPFVLMREFARRFAFAHLKIGHALTLDVVVALLFVVSLAWLGRTAQLSAATAFLSLAGSCGLACLAWLYLARRQFALRLAHFSATLEQSWTLGKWLLSNQLAVGNGVRHLLAVVDDRRRGRHRHLCRVHKHCCICESPNLWILQYLTPRFVRTLRSEGLLALRRQAARDALVLGAVMATFFVLVLLFGDELMQLLYPGSEYRGNGHTLVVLAAASMVAAIGAPAAVALMTAEHARAVALIAAGTALLTCILVWALMSRWGLVGAAYALLVAETVGNLGRWTAFMAVSADSPGQPARI